MESLIHCIYASTATAQFKEEDLAALLEKARTNNARRRITGILLYVERSFFQVLEGNAAEVEATYGLIAGDARHTRVTRIIHEPIPKRDFADWTMGVLTPAARDVGQWMGENDFFAAGRCLADLGTGRAKKLLTAFRDGRWRTEHTGTFRTPGRRPG